MFPGEMTTTDQHNTAQRPSRVRALPPEQQHFPGTRPAHHDDGITIIEIQNPQTPEMV